MARTHRPHQPGAAFHIVTRTQGHGFLFTPSIKREINRLIIEEVPAAGARLISHVVMDNHIHGLLFQGSSRLGWVMQPILRRAALLVQRHHAIEGHVFERRFRSKQCENSEHLRNCILYVHRNPVEGGMCERPADYEFGSAGAYEGNVPCGHICVEEGLQLFGCTLADVKTPANSRYVEEVRRPLNAEVREFFDYWMHRRERQRALPITRWKEHEPRPARDVRDASLQLLKVIDPNVDVDVVRSRYGGPEIVRIRTKLIASLLQRGYSGSCIAGYLRISPATVSRIRSRMRAAGEFAKVA